MDNLVLELKVDKVEAKNSNSSLAKQTVKQPMLRVFISGKKLHLVGSLLSSLYWQKLIFIYF